MGIVDGKVAIVTGATSGIGTRTVEALMRRARVWSSQAVGRRKVTSPNASYARFRSRELHQWHRYYRGRWDDWWTHVYATPGIAEANAHSFAGSYPILECRFTSR